MTSLSLFDAMEEFSLQPENYLDETFSLSADLLAADLQTEGSILDLGQSQNGVFKPKQTEQERLEDLLLPDPVGESFGEDWMETVDIHSLLNNDVGGAVLSQLPTLPPILDVKPLTIPDVKPEPPRQEGMKQSAFELLKALLTGTVETQSIQTSNATVEPILPISPEARVPDLPFFNNSFVEEVDSRVLYEGDINQSNNSSLKEFIEIQPEICLDNGDIIEIKPPVTVASSDTVGSNILDSELFTNIFNTDLASSPSNDDIESLLSSGPSSPENSVTLYTIDSSYLDSSIQSSSDKSSQISDVEFTQISECIKSPKAKKESSRPSPYEMDPPYNDKKSRKKVQNKNAATRYRVKKKVEKESLHEQENRLSDKNKELREKVESLQREISYMKELMNEIHKAKKSNYK